MKKLVLLLLATIVVVGTKAQTDSVIESQQMKILQIDSVLNDVKSVNERLIRQNEQLSLRVTEIEHQIDTLHATDTQTTTTISATTSELHKSISNVETNAENGNAKISKNLQLSVIIGLVLVLLVLVISLVLHFVLKKSSYTTFDKIKETQNKLQQESLNLDKKLIELLDKQLSIQKSTPQQTEPDHSLALKVADEIVRIETNLSRMDANVKGYKQLSASVRRIKENFLSNGYEIVDMLGKPYKEGMKVVPTFVTDDTLNKGIQIITGIIKPQINYNGVMIQTAQITVSQN